MLINPPKAVKTNTHQGTITTRDKDIYLTQLWSQNRGVCRGREGRTKAFVTHLIRKLGDQWQLLHSNKLSNISNLIFSRELNFAVVKLGIQVEIIFKSGRSHWE